MKKRMFGLSLKFFCLGWIAPMTAIAQGMPGIEALQKARQLAGGHKIGSR